METTQVKGTINETHSGEVRKCFGDKVADRLETAKHGELFLDIVFAGYATEMKEKQRRGMV